MVNGPPLQKGKMLVVRRGPDPVDPLLTTQDSVSTDFRVTWSEFGKASEPEPDRARAAGREWSMALPIDGMRGFTFAPPPAAAAAARTPHPFRAFEGRRGFDLCGQSTE